MPFEPTPHPILKIPTAKEMMAMGSERWAEAMKRREDIIAKEKLNPLQHGWEPPIWKVCDALLDLPWVEKTRVGPAQDG